MIVYFVHSRPAKIVGVCGLLRMALHCLLYPTNRRDYRVVLGTSVESTSGARTTTHQCWD